jgi:ankyrin repeat protein
MDINGSTPLHLASSLRHSNGFRKLLEANPTAVFKADNNGLFPIHVAASVGAEDTVRIILEMFPSCAGLRTAQGWTFLHVSIENKRMPIVFFVCKTPSLAWILNMQDNDGNTALHLAVQAKSLRMFGSLFGSKEVHLGLANGNRQTPVDISRAMLPRGLYFDWVMCSHLN